MTELTTPVSTPRLVPGAPPLGSTSQRKKRKTTKSKAVDSPIEPPVAIPDSTAAALVERAPDATDIQEGSVAPELVVQPENESVTDDNSPKPSPVAELIQKRTKALGKKITRISSYASIEYEKLNDDQKRTLKTLPALEAVHKELDDVKKAIEAHEADYGRELALQKAEAKRAEQARISEAISVTKASCIDGTLSIFSLIRLRSSLATGAISSALDFNDIEGSAIFGVTDTLLGVDSEAKRDVVDGLMSGEGSFNEVAYARILDIVSSFLHPVREPSPLPTDAESIHEGDAAVLAPGTPPISMTAAGAPTNGSSGFHFMQASELDGPSFESAELVEKPSTSTEANSLESQVEDVAVTDPSIDVPSNGQPADTPAPNGALDWADEEGGLPSIATLQATFAPSGAATPLAENIGTSPPPAEPSHERQRSDSDGQHRGRGRGRGGFRGERGRGRGEFRGERGRGRGEFRGERGLGGRGGPRRSDGDWRSPSDDNHRGGRGRGRGGDREDRGERGRGGDRGDRGERGERGDRRDRGDRGERGERGNRGDRGGRGERGGRGGRGERGDRGDRGDRGGFQERREAPPS